MKAKVTVLSQSQLDERYFKSDLVNTHLARLAKMAIEEEYSIALIEGVNYYFNNPQFVAHDIQSALERSVPIEGLSTIKVGYYTDLSEAFHGKIYVAFKEIKHSAYWVH